MKKVNKGKVIVLQLKIIFKKRRRKKAHGMLLGNSPGLLRIGVPSPSFAAKHPLISLLIDTL